MGDDVEPQTISLDLVTFSPADYPFLSFDQLATVSIDRGIDDDAWLPGEDADEKLLLANDDQLPLFS